ncbi:MAG: hypothetical protein KGH78_03655 [Candidatus Micrarchaeota archaeon]|nr:hypothetical protein [Candidatus Micrarchaeota archaeon]
MGIFAKTFGSMHNLTIILLSALIVASSYDLGQFPASVIAALITVVALEALFFKFYKRHRVKIPYSGIITALIIGSVVPQNAVLVAIAASAIAVGSIFFIRSRNGNIFNPATFGMFVSLGVLSVGDAWWGSTASLGMYGFAVPFAIILGLAAYEARRLTASFAFILASLAIGAIFAGNFTLSGIVAALVGINFYFAFIMLAEPKTSPHIPMQQAAYGAGVAVLYYLLATSRLGYPFLFALLLGNLAYAAYRRRQRLA